MAVRVTASASPREESTLERCPACGERLGSPIPEQCPLCKLRLHGEFIPDHDPTPFAAAYAEGGRGWLTMVRWVYAAGEMRLKHLAPLRVSTASAHFARVNLLLASFGLGGFEWTRIGWRWMGEAVEGAIASPTRPVGSGWLHVVNSTGRTDGVSPGQTTDLWWNAAEALIAVPLSIALGFAVGLVLLTVFRGLLAWMHAPPFYRERRMGAAVCYSTAWLVPIVVACVVRTLRPLAYAGAVARWSWYPRQQAFDVVAGVGALGGLILWWFWLIRLAGTAPTATRARVVVFVTVGAPLLVTGTAVAWYVGFPTLCGILFRALGFQA